MPPAPKARFKCSPGHRPGSASKTFSKALNGRLKISDSARFATPSCRRYNRTIARHGVSGWLQNRISVLKGTADIGLAPRPLIPGHAMLRPEWPFYGLDAAAGVLSRHTVTSIDFKELTKVRPVTFAVTSRRNPVTFLSADGQNQPGRVD
jgi:hypothetical protein